jgi:hypothetical protein
VIQVNFFSSINSFLNQKQIISCTQKYIVHIMNVVLVEFSVHFVTTAALNEFVYVILWRVGLNGTIVMHQQFRDDLDRKLQAQELARIMDKR